MEGRWRARDQRPRQISKQGAIPAREQQFNRKPKESSDQKHPRKAAHSRRSHSQQSAPDETTEIRKPKSRCGGTVASTQPASPSAETGRGHPRESNSQQKAKGKFGSKHPRKAAHAAAVVTTQQSAPDETTEIRKPRVGVEGRWRAREPASPSTEQGRGHPREATAIQQKPKESSDQSTQGGP